VPGLFEACAIAQPGDEVRLPPRAHLGRFGFLIATAQSPDACDAVLDEAASLVELRHEPLGMPELYEGRPW
jgi:hypothetical protein